MKEHFAADDVLRFHAHVCTLLQNNVNPDVTAVLPVSTLLDAANDVLSRGKGNISSSIKANHDDDAIYNQLENIKTFAEAEKATWERKQTRIRRRRYREAEEAFDRQAARMLCERVESPTEVEAVKVTTLPSFELARSELLSFEKKSVLTEEEQQDQLVSGMFMLARQMKQQALTTNDLLQAGNADLDQALINADVAELGLKQALLSISAELESAGGLWIWLLLVVAMISFVLMVIFMKWM